MLGKQKRSTSVAVASGGGSGVSKPKATRERGLDRTLDLLACLHRTGRSVRVADLARALGAPRSPIYWLVKVLTEAGLLESGNGGEIFFGKTLYFYGMAYLREHDLLARARGEADRLARDTGETTQLCVLHERKYAVAYMSAGRRPFRISSEVGTRIPLPWTASGRLLLSDLTPDQIRAFVPPEDLHPPRSEPISMNAFVAAVAEARRQGFCMTSGLVDPFTHCVAAPVRDASGRVVATLCFVVPIDTPSERIESLRHQLLESGRTLSLSPEPS